MTELYVRLDEGEPAPAQAPPAPACVRLDYGRLGKAEPTQVGGVKIPARLARTGIQLYRLPDGTTRRELRLPEEVFNADSLKTIADAPVTIGHPRVPGGLIDATNWKGVSVGHARDVRADGGAYVSGELIVQDAAAVDAIDRDELADISMGYVCKLDFTPGVWQGQSYDAIQRDIRYNHVALLPKGGGRAGTDVGLRLDSNGAEAVESRSEEIMVKVIKLDGKEYEVGSELHLDKIDEMHKAEVAALKTAHASEIATVKKDLDGMTAKFDVADKDLKKVQADLAAAQDPKAIAARVDARVGLEVKARNVLGVEAKFDSKSDREIMLEVIKADDKDFIEKDRSDDYIAATFDAVVKRGVRVDGVHSVVKTVEELKRLDEKDPVTKAYNDNATRNREMWKQPLTASKDSAGK